MKKIILKAAYIASFAFCLATLSAHASNRESALVTKVEDGDTIKVLIVETKTEATVRFTDIDAPEIGHGQSRPGQPFGRKAHAAMSQMLSHKYVDLECYPGETYGRRICRVFVDGVDAAESLVAMGLAWVGARQPRRIWFTISNTRSRRCGKRAISPVSAW